MSMRLIDAESLKELFPDNGEGSWTYNATAKAYIDAQPEQQNARIFQGVIVEYPTNSTYPEHEGKPYFLIKYTEDGQDFIGYGTYKPDVLSEYLKKYFMPSAQPNTTTHDSIPAKTGKNDEDRTSGDCISRTQAIDTIEKHLKWTTIPDYYPGIFEAVRGWLNGLPSAQPERTCVNCGRTANNGGWYADGRTRCPIEEHYALPKDGYCHLWEKRNVTDDDYPERREE